MEQKIKKTRASGNSKYNNMVELISQKSAKLKFPQITKTPGSIAAFGLDNQFPNEILHLYTSPIHSSILHAKLNMVYGSGLIYKPGTPIEDFFNNLQNEHDLDYHFRKAAWDYLLFGGFYLLVRFDYNNDISEIEHVDFKNVRVTLDEKGNINNFAYNPEFTTDIYNLDRIYKREDTVIFPKFDYKHARENASMGQKEQLFYFFSNTNILEVYPLPDWYFMQSYIQLDIELATYYLATVQNSFTPSAVIKIPSAPSAKVREAIMKEMIDKFTKTSEANKIIALFGHKNAEGDAQMPEISAFEGTGNADIYNSLNEHVIKMITSLHRFPASLLGIQTAGLSITGNSAEISSLYDLTITNVIQPIQQIFTDTFNKFARYNGITEKFLLKTQIPLNFRITQQLLNAQAQGIITTQEVRNILGFDENITETEAASNVEIENIK